ncbi:TniQ family protein [Herminiimonas aquatilis]|uniref:TniQ family protein n=1 Tax=Herminiimonas aquatilis TaxID=345342 RepID=A0ABW2J3C9_9BURK
MFLIRPQPLSGESLSSWRQRSGIANGFRRFPSFKDSDGYKTDYDRMPKEAELNWLVEQFRISSIVLSGLTLESLGGKISDEFDKSHKLRWVIPIMANDGRARGVYCPVCIAEDDEPYFRLSWRFAFLTSCPKHQCVLQDRCPSCHKGIWPFNLKSTRSMSMERLSICFWCGHDLSVLSVTKSAELFSLPLWTCANHGKVPKEISQAQNVHDVFSGLWALCQLMIRSSSSKIIKQLPARMIFTLNCKSSVIELSSLKDRAQILDAAYWLMQDWPERFVCVAKKAEISLHHFTSSGIVMPGWLNEVVNDSLVRRQSWVVQNDVNAAIDELSKSGQKISKKSVRRILEISESKVLNEMLSQRRQASWQEFKTLIFNFEDKLQHTPSSRSQQATLLRDYLIFLASVISNKSIEEVCKLSKLETQLILAAQAGDNEKSQYIRARALDLNCSYATKERIELSPLFLDNGIWFVSRFGGVLAGHTVRDRVTKLMLSGFPNNLWKSADVFRNLAEMTRK